MANDIAKQAAAFAAAKLMRTGQTVGLGTGSTTSFFIDALAERVRTEHILLRCIATSRATAAHAKRLGLAVLPLAANALPDVVVDGADEIDPDLHLIKGGGGALVQEKIVAISGRELIVIADGSKLVPVLGGYPLPVAIVPFGYETTLARIRTALEVEAHLRLVSHQPVVTDDGLYVVDCHFGAIEDPAAIEARLKPLVGVVETGLFIGMATRALIGDENGRVRTLLARRS